MTTTTTWASRGTAPRAGVVEGEAPAPGDVAVAVAALGAGEDGEDVGAEPVAAPLHPASTTAPSPSPTSRPTRIPAL
ncbi:MAG: hypothetical protein ACTHJ6_05040 [Oryzihumus sp.]